MLFDTPEKKTEKIAGLEVEYRYLSALHSPRVLGQFISDIGHVGLEFLRGSDLVYIRESVSKVMAGEMTTKDVPDLFDAAMKAIASDGFEELLNRMGNEELLDINKYATAMIPHTVTIGNRQIQRIEELDEMGASPVIVFKILVGTMIYNFRPTFGEDSTSDGSPPEKPNPGPVTRTATRTVAKGSAKKRSKGGKSKAGR